MFHWLQNQFYIHSVVDLHIMCLTNGCKNIILLCTTKRINCKQVLLSGCVTLPSVVTTMNFVMMHMALV